MTLKELVLIVVVRKKTRQVTKWETNGVIFLKLLAPPGRILPAFFHPEKKVSLIPMLKLDLKIELFD